jgi:hypothetical protein
MFETNELNWVRKELQVADEEADPEPEPEPHICSITD